LVLIVPPSGHSAIAKQSAS